MNRWNDVVDSFGPMVFRIARRIVGNSADAEDLMQTTFLEAYQLQQKEAVKNWAALLRRIVTNRAYDLLKQKRRLRALGEEHDEVAGGATPYEQLAHRELVERLKHAVAELPPQQACAFWLRYFDSCSNDEIAKAMGISSHGVAAALNKARTALSPKFEQSPCGRKQ